jgi:hypothetical protein
VATVQESGIYTSGWIAGVGHVQSLVCLADIQNPSSGRLALITQSRDTMGLPSGH